MNFGQSGFVFIEANVKKWGLAPITGSLAPPPPYGSEQGSILLEAGRDVVYTNQNNYIVSGHSRSRSGNTWIRPPNSPGPIRSPTDISLAQLSHIPSNEDIGEGNSRITGIRAGISQNAIHYQETDNNDTRDFTAPPPEYTSPNPSGAASRPSSQNSNEESASPMRPISPRPPIPSYDAVVGSDISLENNDDTG